MILGCLTCFLEFQFLEKTEIGYSHEGVKDLLFDWLIWLARLQLSNELKPSTTLCISRVVALQQDKRD